MSVSVDVRIGSFFHGSKYNIFVEQRHCAAYKLGVEQNQFVDMFSVPGSLPSQPEWKLFDVFAFPSAMVRLEQQEKYSIHLAVV